MVPPPHTHIHTAHIQFISSYMRYFLGISLSADLMSQITTFFLSFHLKKPGSDLSGNTVIIFKNSHLFQSHKITFCKKSIPASNKDNVDSMTLDK